MLAECKQSVITQRDTLESYASMTSLLIDK